MVEKDRPFRGSEYLGPLKNEAHWAEQALAGELEAHLFLCELDNGEISTDFYYSAQGDLTMLELSTMPLFNAQYAGVVTDKQLIRDEIERLHSQIAEFELQEILRKAT